MKDRLSETSCQTGSQPAALDSLLAYHLPPDQIATEPLRPRDSARLLLVLRKSQSLADHLVRDLPNLLSLRYRDWETDRKSVV